MVEPYLEQIRRRRITRNMSAEFAVSLVRAHHHRERIPAQRGGEPLLEFEIAGITRLLLERDGVLIRRHVRARRFHAKRQRMARELVEQKLRALAADMRDHAVERRQPFGGFLRIRIGLLPGVRMLCVQKPHLLATAGQIRHGTTPASPRSDQDRMSQW
jgi:hypothetical protein